MESNSAKALVTLVEIMEDKDVDLDVRIRAASTILSHSLANR